MFREKNGSRREEKVGKRGNAYLLLEFSVFLLGVDEIQDDVEGSGQDERQEEAKSSEVSISLCAEYLALSVCDLAIRCRTY